MAIDLASESAQNGGGPFGAIIVKNGEVIGRGHNQVTENCDPSAHAEIVAIRKACQQLNDFQLTDATLYTSCEPCPMCFSAIYWARITRVYYAATAEDAAKAGFDDAFIYQELDKPVEQRRLPMQQLAHEQSTKSFKIWLGNNERKEY